MAKTSRRTMPPLARRALSDVLPIMPPYLVAAFALREVYMSDGGTALNLRILAVVVCLVGVAYVWVERWRERRATSEAQTAAGRARIQEFPELVSELLHDVHRVHLKHGSTLVGTAMQQPIMRCASALSDFERGRFTTDFDDNAWVFRLTEDVQESMLASSVQDVDLAFWNSPAGQYYWDLQNRKLSGRNSAPGISIRRIFIYQSWTAQLDDLAEEQAAAGVSVMRVPLDRVPPRLVKDMIVWDETVGCETRVNAAGSADENVFTVDREDVARLVEQLELLRTLAEHYSPGSGRARPASAD